MTKSYTTFNIGILYLSLLKTSEQLLALENSEHLLSSFINIQIDKGIGFQSPVTNQASTLRPFAHFVYDG